MKRLATMVPLLCLLSSLALAQPTWQRSLPISSINAAYSALHLDGQTYRLHSNNGLMQFDADGVVTGYVPFPGGVTNVVSSVLARQTTPGAPPALLLARRTLQSGNTLRVTEYRPGVGYVHDLPLDDLLNSVAVTRPLLLDMPDGAIWVFGRQFLRKMTYSPVQGFAEVWARPLDRDVADAQMQGNQIVVAETNGGVTAFDLDGQVVWTQQHAYTLRALAVVPGGFVVCGRNDALRGIVLRLDAGGAEVWKTETDDREYWAIVATSDGGLAVAGQSQDGRAILTRLSGNGAVLWQQAYSNGAGICLAQSPDGGFVVVNRPPTGTLSIAKTDATGQTSALEPAETSERSIRTSDVRAVLYPWYLPFLAAPLGTPTGPNPFFFALPEAAVTTAFAPWIGGRDAAGNTFIAAGAYSSSNRRDYRPGIAHGAEGDFQRVWAVSREAINRLRLDFGADQTLDQPVPFDILTWPAKGNPHWRFNLNFTPVQTDPALFPAPFVDVNGDGIYNVYDGDYPKIQGDVMAWWALTDSVPHTFSHTSPLVVDLLASAYAYDCPQSPSVGQSLFVEFEVINRSDKHYEETHFGIWADPDLGCYNDDFIGSLPAENAWYVYNANDFDDECGVPGFGAEIPVQTIAFLNADLDHFAVFNNPSVGVPSAATADPQQPHEFFNYLTGKWRDGVPFTTGGNGYNPSSTNTTAHLFSGDPADPQGWSMCTANLPDHDRRTLASHGPFDFATGDTFRLQVAMTVHPNIPHPCPNISATVQPATAQLRQWQNSGALSVVPDLGQVVGLPPGQQVTLNAGVPGGTAYLWSTGETASSILVSAPGNYAVTVTAATGCQLVEDVLVQLGTPVLPPASPPAFRILPNPVQDFLFVECLDCSDSALRAELQNAQGTLVRQGVHTGGRWRLETHGLPAGVYVLRLWAGEQYLGSRKVVVARGGE